MNPKGWTRLSTALVGLAVVGYLLLLRPSSPLRLIPRPERTPDAEPARRIPSSEKQLQKAPSTSTRSEKPDASETRASPSKKDVHVTQAPGTLRDPGSEGLIRDTKDLDWRVRWDAVNKLGELEDRRAIPALVERALYDDNSHPRWRSLWALSAVDRTGSEAVPLLLSGLYDTDPVVARNAAVALAFFGQTEARPELLKGLNDYDTFRRWEAVFSLQDIGNEEVVAALVPLLWEVAEPEEGVRSQVALTLGYIGGQGVILPLVKALQTDPSPQVRWRAAMMLSRIGNSPVISELEKAMATERDLGLENI